jgi:hypothetical protein
VSPLERRYRYLLACYPAGYRKTYGEEMLGVLMAAAPDGHERPSLADALNLARSGLRARLRAVGTGTDQRWRDALAVYSLVAPVVVTAAVYQAPWFLDSLLWGDRPPGSGQLQPLAILYRAAPHLSFATIGIARYVVTMLSLLIPVVLALLRLRRTALLVATFLLVWITIQASLGWQIQAPNTIAFLAMLVVEVAALIASDGPRRGLRLVTWRGLLLAIPWVAVGVVADLEDGATSVYVSRHWLVLAVLAAAATLASAKARRVVLLFAIPVSAFVVVVRPSEAPDAMYLAPALVAVVAFFVSRRSVHERLTGRDGIAGRTA